MAGDDVGGERERRLAIWSRLRQRGGPNDVSPTLVKELRIHRGQQGVFRDQAATAALTPHGEGIAVGVLHTGSRYADDLFDDGLIYHYPTTRRGDRDRNEITALKTCADLHLPIFVVVTPHSGSKTRDVRLGWIIDTDDMLGQLLISFADTAPPADFPSNEDEEVFLLKAPRPISVGTSRRHRRKAHFRFAVFKRYGPACAFCSITEPTLLEAAHLCPVEEDGTDDPRNGLVMCPTHHKAFDAGLLVVHPDTLAVHVGKHASLEAVGVKVPSIEHLRRYPHREALAWVWSRWQRQLDKGFER